MHESISNIKTYLAAVLGTASTATGLLLDVSNVFKPIGIIAGAILSVMACVNMYFIIRQKIRIDKSRNKNKGEKS